MSFPTVRMRRLRQSPQIRDLVRETRLHPNQLLSPMFIVPGKGIRREISSLPGQFHESPDQAIEHAKKLRDLGISGTLLFGLPAFKDEVGSASWQDDGVVQQAIRGIKEEVPGFATVPDLCFCEYTSHGHCGVLKGEVLDNDETLENLKKQTLSLARSGADIIAPSGMIDGVVGAIRSALDQNKFENVAIMGYSAKYASAYYGPFREAVASTPSFGDRKSYQMDPANIKEALREVALDIEEGADIVMVKPALSYLDVIKAVKDTFGLPTAAYNVSGEYAMIKAAAEKGWIDGKRVMDETLLSIRRAGADIIITYFAEEFAAAY